MNRPPQTHVFANQLSREWEYLRRRPAVLAHARGWRSDLPAGNLAAALDGLSDLEQIVDATGSEASGSIGSGWDAEAALLHLVVLAQHDQLAGRILIQRLLPGLVAHAARYRSRRDDIDPAEMVVAAAWIAIRRYDAAVRRRHVASSLISDATFQAFRQPMRRRSASEVATPVEQFALRSAPSVATTALEQLADVVRLARTRGVPAADLQFVRDLVQVGSAVRLAANQGVTPRTIRNRRDRAVANIRRAIAA
jgi:hypothetical protein